MTALRWGRLRETNMRTLVIAAAAVAALAGAGGSAPAQAAGCLSGAAVGGVAGHVAGHGLLGAAAGCVVGHHMAARNRAAQEQAQYNDGTDRSFPQRQPGL